MIRARPALAQEVAAEARRCREDVGSALRDDGLAVAAAAALIGGQRLAGPLRAVLLGDLRHGAALGEGAAAVSGKIVSATEGKSLPAKVRVFLIPAEPTAAEDVLRYRELISADGKFHFKNLAPGKYRVLARSDSGEPTARPAAYEATERARLRREAEAAGQEFSLSLCQRRNDLEVKYTSNP